jgi:hypothetical protein
MPKMIILLSLAVSLAFAIALPAQAQMQLGTITVANDPIACSSAPNGSKFYPGMTCFGATISQCPGVMPINITFGWTGPAAPTIPQGTIVFFSGDGGRAPTENGDDIPAYAPVYVNRFNIVYVEYNGTPWEDPNNGAGGNILAAACRPATFLKYINDNSVIHQGAMCAQGFSAGSAALAYSMSWYGAWKYLKNAEFLSGPVLSEIDQGCTYPNAATPTICPAPYCSFKTQTWSDKVIYVYPNYTAINTWSGLNGCATAGGGSAWKTMDIVQTPLNGTPNFSFPNVAKHGWLCQSYANDQSCSLPSCPNNSAAQGKYFYDAVNATGDTSLTVTGVQNCEGPEGVAQGTDPDTLLGGAAAIEKDMQNSCTN